MLPSLNLCSPRPEQEFDECEDEDIVAADLDMHQLIASEQPKQVSSYILIKGAYIMTE